MTAGYPFTAIVGQDQLKLALMLCAISPTVGGVLIRGDKGTAKSTAARGLAEVMPPIEHTSRCQFNCTPGEPIDICQICHQPNGVPGLLPVPFINLPLGATEDRLLGSLDFERALKEGKKAFQPGLLASAHRGILYIDEVNLLADHLVDLLLDVAAMGVNSIQREGLSISHPSRIGLIGTMNPEEGDLRPQLLDRFGLMVEVVAPKDAPTRAEVVRRRFAFDSDPEGFASHWEIEQRAVRAKLLSAQRLLPSATVDDRLLLFISKLCCELEVNSLRADIVMHKAARGIAALNARTQVTAGDIQQAAELVLPHRRRNKPSEQSGLSKQQLEQLMQQAYSDQTDPQGNSSDHDHQQEQQDEQEGNDQEDGQDQSPATEQLFSAADPTDTVTIKLRQTSAGNAGRRATSISARQGRYVRAVADEKPTSLAIDATIRHSVLRNNGELNVERSDLHQKVHATKNSSLILFVVDASGSMASAKRMESVKGSVLALLTDAYQQRDTVGVISFRGGNAELLLAPTRSTQMAEQSLRDLPTGGRTPLAHALKLSRDTLRQAAQKGSPEPLLIILSDGKANVSIATEQDPWKESLEIAEALCKDQTPSLVIDTESGHLKLGRARDLATALQAEYIQLDQLSAESLTITIRKRLRGRKS